MMRAPLPTRRRRSARSFMSPALCFTPMTPGTEAMIRARSCGREVGPRDDVVDDDGQARPAGQRVEVLQHRVVVGAEEIVDGRHLQRGHAEVLDGEPALDGGGGAVGDDAGDDRHASLHFLGHDGGDAAHLVGGEGMAFAGAAGRRRGRGPWPSRSGSAPRPAGPPRRSCRRAGTVWSSAGRCRKCARAC